MGYFLLKVSYRIEFFYISVGLFIQFYLYLLFANHSISMDQKKINVTGSNISSIDYIGSSSSRSQRIINNESLIKQIIQMKTFKDGNQLLYSLNKKLQMLETAQLERRFLAVNEDIRIFQDEKAANNPNQISTNTSINISGGVENMLKVKRNQISNFLGKLCKKLFSVAFNLLKDQQLTFNKVKAYCSQNILRNIIRLSKEYNLDSQDFIFIDEVLQKQLLPNFCLLYPQTEEKGKNKKLQSELIETNLTEDNQYDMIYKSGVKFDFRVNQKYNSDIMKFLNFIISLPNNSIELEDSMVSGNQTKLNMTTYQAFQKDIQDIFNKIQSEQQKIKMLHFNPKDPNQKKGQIHNIGIKKMNSGSGNIQPNNQKQKQRLQYARKVKSYTQIQIGQKIPKSLDIFTDYQIRNGENLTLKDSSLMRIISKWCQELESYFDEKKFLNRQFPFRMKDGNQIYLKKFKMELLNLFLQQEYKKVKQFRENMKKKNYEFIKQFATMEINQLLKKSFEDEAIVGQFTSFIYRINQSCLINYLNKLIHSINLALKNFQQYQLVCRYFGEEQIEKKIQKSQEIPSEVSSPSPQRKLVEKEEEEEEKKKKIFFTNFMKLNQCIKQQAKKIPYKIEDYRYVPQLITFKVGDLLRCRCTSKQEQIIALYRQIEKISFQTPSFIKILRVKNKLSLNNKDILMNLLYRKKTIIEMQLAIKSEKTKFIVNSNKFNHYFYELKRAELGAIFQMCNIWMNHDLRSEFYLQKTQEINYRKPLTQKQKSNKKSCCQTVTYEAQNPFRCHLCTCFYFDYNNQNSIHSYCNECEKYTCFLCFLEITPQDQLKKNVKIKEVKKTQKSSIGLEFIRVNQGSTIINQKILLDIKVRKIQQIPQNGGVLINMKNEQPQTKFKTIYYEGQYYLFQRIFGKIKLIEKFKSKKFPYTFLKKNIVIEIPQNYVPKITLKDCHNYFIQQHLDKCLKQQKNALTIVKKEINQKIFQTYQQKNTIFKKVQKLNLSENSFCSIDFLAQLFPNLQSAILNYNFINLTVDRSKIKYWKSWKNLKKLHIKKNKITSFGMIISNFPELVQLDLSENNIDKIPQQISLLKKLQKLDISQNRITSIGKKIGDLNNLKELILNGNFFSEIPQQLCKLSNLTYLSICRNGKLNKLPQNIGNLTSLESLHLIYNNQIKYLPRSFTNLHNLCTLIIQKNKKLQFMAQNFQNLKSLKILFIHNNQSLKKIPENIDKLQLNSLIIAQNYSLNLKLQEKQQKYRFPKVIFQKNIPEEEKKNQQKEKQLENLQYDKQLIKVNDEERKQKQSLLRNGKINTNQLYNHQAGFVPLPSTLNHRIVSIAPNSNPTVVGSIPLEVKNYYNQTHPVSSVPENISYVQAHPVTNAPVNTSYVRTHPVTIIPNNVLIPIHQSRVKSYNQIINGSQIRGSKIVLQPVPGTNILRTSLARQHQSPVVSMPVNQSVIFHSYDPFNKQIQHTAVTSNGIRPFNQL